MNQSQSFVVGIYPGGSAGGDNGLIEGKPDDPQRVKEVLDRLQGTASPFIVRAYRRFSDAGVEADLSSSTPHFEHYLNDRRRLDMVLMFQSSSGNVDGFLAFVSSMVREYGERMYSLQVTEEANFTDGPDCIDGAYERVDEALVRGVITAKREARRCGFHHLKVGFNATPTFGPGADFWSRIGKLGGREFVDSLDYVGLDFFPDVFHPVATEGEEGDLRSSVVAVLQSMRSTWLPAAGICPSVPIHITEHGWPTSSTRSAERQETVIDSVIRIILDHRESLNIERYMLFALRDTDDHPKNSDNIFCHFGLMHADYTPKPAFEAFRKVIAEVESQVKVSAS